MQADPLAQRRLLDIVAIDNQVTVTQHKMRTLPEHEQLGALAKQRAMVLEQIVAGQTRLRDAETEQARLEADLTPAKQRLARDEERLESGAVADQRGIRGLQEEIAHLKGRISDLEDAELGLMQRIEDETSAVATLTAQRTDLETQMRGLMVTRDAAGKTLSEELAQLARRRASLVATLPPDLTSLYDKISAKVGVGGAAELRAGRCTGCGMHIDRAELTRFAAALPQEVLRCEECDRILVRTDASGLA